MSVSKFFKSTKTGEKEMKRRVMVSLAAFAYEIRNEIIMSDSDFDKLCLQIDPSIDTGHEVLDKFFREKFDPSTGMWIRDHPELHKVEALYDRSFSPSAVRTAESSES